MLTTVICFVIDVSGIVDSIESMLSGGGVNPVVNQTI